LRLWRPVQLASMECEPEAAAWMVTFNQAP